MTNHKNVSKNLEHLKKELEIDEHLISIPELCARYNTSVTGGLADNQVQLNLEKYGKNVLTPPPTKPEWLVLVENFLGWFNMLLWFGAILCCITAYFEHKFESDSGSHVNNYFLGLILASVVIVTGLFSYSQEKKSGKIMDSFKDLLPANANVIRGDTKKEVLVEELVVGDLVEIKGGLLMTGQNLSSLSQIILSNTLFFLIGDQVPADIRLVTNHFLKVDNSSITGESDPQPRSLNDEHHNPLEARNLMFFSTNCLEGNGTGIVIRTGDTTCMGK